MKASELIIELQGAIEKYGDLEVFAGLDWDYVNGVDHKEAGFWDGYPEVISLEW